MKQVLIRAGSAVVSEVPAPAVGRANVLVAVECSCVSVGTEMAGVRMSALPLYRRALKQPENVRRVLEMARDQGIRRTMDRVRGKLSAGTPTGYSAAGTIVEVGEQVSGFSVGDRVACAGAGIANHAEYIDVPVNLAARIPDGLASSDASTVTLGAIAMQGLRRAAPTLGETVLVVGLGILGQLTVQFLRANGCRVIGVDVDPGRIDLALGCGMEEGIDPSTEDYVERVVRLTEGFGADAAIVTAASPSDAIVSEAMRACRRKGRVVLVGDVGLGLRREDLYRKELDFLVSTSYGPGRYDPSYEEGGQDYPLAYVRWTENRNMQAYLELLAAGRVSIEGVRAERYPVDRAGEAYEALKREGAKPLLVLLEYPPPAGRAPERVVAVAPAPRATSGKVRIGLAGAGSFAQGMHLPNLVKLRAQFELRGVMSRSGANAKAVATQYEAAYATTDYAQLLADADIDLVLIATRHDLHASMVLQALEAGKHVFVEKPLALSEAELAPIESFYARHPDGPLLMTGFNRRFAPALAAARSILAGRATPLMVDYRMNAGFIPPEHWVHGPEGGGRNIGEACHIYDLFRSLTGARVAGVTAHAVRPRGAQWRRNDNFSATIGYEDGSVCTLTYTAMGAKAHPKERMEIFADGKVLVLDDYRSLAVTGARRPGWSSATARKGQMEELEALGACLRGGGTWPIPLAEQLETTRVSFEVERQLHAEPRAGAAPPPAAD